MRMAWSKAILEPIEKKRKELAKQMVQQTIGILSEKVMPWLDSTYDQYGKIEISSELVVNCLEILSKVIELSLRTKKCDDDKAELATNFFGFAAEAKEEGNKPSYESLIDKQQIEISSIDEMPAEYEFDNEKSRTIKHSDTHSVQLAASDQPNQGAPMKPFTFTKIKWQSESPSKNISKAEEEELKSTKPNSKNSKEGASSMQELKIVRSYPKDKYTFTIGKELSFGDKNKVVVIQGHITIADGKGNDQYKAVLSRSADPSLTALIVMNCVEGDLKLRFKAEFSEFSVLYAYPQLPHGNSKQDPTPIVIATSYPKPDEGKGKIDQALVAVYVADSKYKSLVLCKGDFSIAKQYFKLYQPRGAHKPLTSDLVDTEFAYLDLLCMIDTNKLMYTRQKRTSNWFDTVPKKNCSFKVEVKAITDYNLDVVGPEQKSGNRLLCWIGNRKDSDQLTVGVEVIVKMDHNASIPYKYVKAFHFTVPKQLCIDRIHREDGSSIAVPKGYNLEPCQVILCSEMNVIVVVCLESFDSGAPQSSMQSKTNLATSTPQKKYSVAVLVFTTGRTKKLFNNQEAFEEGANKDSNQNLSDYFEISNFLNPIFETKQEVFALCPVHAVSLRKKLSLSFEPKYCSEPAIRCITTLHKPFPSSPQCPLAHLQIDMQVRGTYGLSRLILSSSPVLSSVSVQTVEYSLDVWSRCIDLSRDGGVMIGSQRDKSGILAMEAVPYSSDNSTKYSIMYTPTKSAVVTLFDDN